VSGQHCSAPCRGPTNLICLCRASACLEDAEIVLQPPRGPREHSRWGSPPKDKRYGGFMTSEKSQTPLVTLFKNAIIKNAHKKGQ
uniref:Opiodes neuropeptide domain-containing protein n=1 Tax=Panthera tigris altaica TaxID=74533 RepID=A0A8C9JPG2_PANTA